MISKYSSKISASVNSNFFNNSGQNSSQSGMGVSRYTCVRFTRFRIYVSWKNNKYQKKLFGLKHALRYMQFLATLKHELFDLRRVIQLYTIFGCAQAKFSFYAILCLHGAFRNVTPRITKNPLCLLWFRIHCIKRANYWI